MSTIQQRQGPIGSAPWQKHQSSPPPVHSSGLQHHLEPIVVKKSRSTDGDVFGGPRKNQSAGDSRSNLKERLLSGDAKLKGHLGHLAAAVAESHRNVSGSSLVKQSKSVADDTTHHRVKENFQPVDIDIYSCENCDRMFCHDDELTQHYLSCEKMSKS